ncbi:hypothetical protein DFH07DRAFT_964943 [Mycena maculata]|uniref:PRISE-like Rossmann-fold domain-containing protein n=1 Tax=Mycena maculata TaxID=230809 RepID=A0AAD7IGT1_9AGAR|nr:hypothetical protein DFH07DRAFT_964943 [Mycena maculata]
MALGNGMLRVLAQSPSRWSKIDCLSRRPPVNADSLPPNATHVPVDFISSPDAIAKTLKEHGKLWSNAEELTAQNTALLANFLSALTLANIAPRRVMLQTGAKHYGVHLGSPKVPQDETDPRVLVESNLYYPQEDLLFDWCARIGAAWNVIRPGPILGAVPDAAMNLA